MIRLLTGVGVVLFALGQPSVTHAGVRFCGVEHKPTVTKVRCLAKRVGSLARLRRLPALKTLILTRSGIRSLRGIHHAAGLTSLTLNYTRVARLASLTRLSRLQELVISNTPVRDLGPLAKIPTLQNLTAWNTRVRDLRPLQKLPKLAHVVLGGTDVRDLSPLRDVKALVALNLERTAVVDLRPLHGLKRLRFVNLRRTQVTATAIAAFRRANPKVRVSGCAGSGPRPCLAPPPAKLPASCARLVTCCAGAKKGRKACTAFTRHLERLRKLGPTVEKQLKTLCRGQRSRWRRQSVEGPRCP